MYLPYGARVKITLKTEEKVEAPTPLPRKKRDPRKTSLFRRDPRRKAASVETALLTENNPGEQEEEPRGDVVKEEEKDLEEPGDKEFGIEEENIEKPENLLEEPAVDNMEGEKIEKCENLFQILKALPLPIDPEMEQPKGESDSDDEKLQIDESFDDTTTREEEEEEEVTIVEEINLPLDMKPLKAPVTAEKSPDQLEVERELLRKLVEEREMLKATLAEAGVLQEDLSINFDEVEEGELSDSCDKEDEDKEKVDSLSALGNSEIPRADRIGLPEPEPIENRFKKYWDDFPEEQGPKC